ALLCGARAPARGRRSEHPADGEAAEHRALFLSLELARAVVARQGELPAPAGDGQAVADFADDRLAVHAVAVAEGVAVEGDVARHDAHVAGGEKVPRPSRQAPARGRGVLAGRAQRRAAEVV